MFGWLYARNIESTPKGEGTFIKRENGYFFKNLLNKFPDDIVDHTDRELDCFFDGFIFDKEELCKKYKCDTWQDVFVKNCNGRLIEDDYRGGFSGYAYIKEDNRTVCFVDHMGIRPAFYYQNNDKLVVSSNINWMIEILKKENEVLTINEEAIRYMLTFGSMIDDSTLVSQIKRILPGYKIIFDDNGISKEQYYIFNNLERNEDISEEDAVELIDRSFRNAIRREFEKDIEYGYQHLVDLSGGLDSRMVCMVAHDMGYTDQTNITYCRRGYVDFKISEKIALDLRHDYIFQPLDTCNWMYELDENVKKSYGLIRYNSLTGGNTLLKTLNGSKFGMEHTGMVGDVIPSSFYDSDEIAFGKPEFGRHLYAEQMKYIFDADLLREYPNQEVFALYTRGLLNAQGSYFIRQNYFEPVSPFLDVDFVNTCLSLPFEFRKKHHIYMAWMKTKYPMAVEYGWEKWGGVKPKESHIKYRRFVTLKRLINIYACKILHLDCTDSMNPLDYWYSHDDQQREYYEQCFEKYIDNAVINDTIKGDLNALFVNGNTCEKGMVLTVLSAVNMYFNEGEK